MPPASGYRRSPPALLPGELAPPDLPPPRSARTAQIVACARMVLEHEGPEALTMRRLGDDLGIRAPSLYKHFESKAAVELALIEDALWEVGWVTHEAVHAGKPSRAISRLLTSYRAHSRAHPHLYRLATGGTLDRAHLHPGLEEWAGNPWYVVSGDSGLAQALWSFAHGMVILELDDRYPPGSDLQAAWRAGAAAFGSVARTDAPAPRS
jgi:AcrR family transcriptional regulator